MIKLLFAKGSAMLRHAQHDSRCHPACPAKCGERAEGWFDKLTMTRAVVVTLSVPKGDETNTLTNDAESAIY